MSKILGKNVLLYIVTQASPEVRTVIGCARTCSLTTNANIAGKSTIGSGKWQEFKALSLNWTASVDGLCTVNQNMNLGALRSYQFSLQPAQIEFEESNADATITYAGAAIITSVQTTGPYADVDNYSVQLQGTGSLISNASLRIIQIQLNIPTSGQTTLTFDFDLLPNATAYTIRIRDITAGTTTNDTAGAAPRTEVINSTHDYAFSYRPEYISGHGNFSPEIFYP